jgi:hypothetical protein
MSPVEYGTSSSNDNNPITKTSRWLKSKILNDDNKNVSDERQPLLGSREGGERNGQKKRIFAFVLGILFLIVAVFGLLVVIARSGSASKLIIADLSISIANTDPISRKR